MANDDGGIVDDPTLHNMAMDTRTATFIKMEKRNEGTHHHPDFERRERQSRNG
jgi:hypothetical protein